MITAYENYGIKQDERLVNISFNLAFTYNECD